MAHVHASSTVVIDFNFTVVTFKAMTALTLKDAIIINISTNSVVVTLYLVAWIVFVFTHTMAMRRGTEVQITRVDFSISNATSKTTGKTSIIRYLSHRTRMKHSQGLKLNFIYYITVPRNNLHVHQDKLPVQHQGE
jgi:hypothetical protein